MIKRSFIIFISVIFLVFSNPVYSKEISPNSIEKYINKISNKFSRTYCNTIQFGISNDGALSFAIGETNKEFKKNKLNNFIDYALLKNYIINDLENNCNFYFLPIQSSGFSNIQSNIPLESRFFDAITNNMGNIIVTTPITANSNLPKPISFRVKPK